MPKVSVVIALYNQEKYVRRFMDSLASQSFEDFEALFVDDASTDASKDLVLDFGRHDSRFKLIEHETNKGAGAARNTGILAATGETLCFADPDDILPENSLEVRYRAYKKHNGIVRACHVEVETDGTVCSQEKRPPSLPEIFSPAEEALRVGVNPFLCAHWTWLFPTKLLQRKKIFNPEGTRTAEDIQFLVSLFFHISRMTWIPDVVYCWMRQTDSLSARTYSSAHYIDYLDCADRFFHLAIQAGKPELGDRFCNDYLIAYFAHLCRQLQSSLSTEGDAREVVSVAVDIATRHGLFKRFLAGRTPPAHSLGVRWLHGINESATPLVGQRLLQGYANVLTGMTHQRYRQIQQHGWETNIRFDRLDMVKRLLRARYFFYKEHPEEHYGVEGLAADFACTKNRLVADGQELDIFERILWLPLPDTDTGSFTLTVGGQGVSHTTREVRQAFAQPAPDARSLAPEERALRKLTRSENVRKRFARAWMFMDRDTQADDNAEHLYRWMMQHHPDINAWFVLRDDAQDWSRLEREGFRLVAFDSMEHKLLFLLAEYLVSSQMDTYIYEYLPREQYGDLRNCKFVCLQHGVINDDLSPWLNSIDIDYFVTSTPREYGSIVEDGSPYLLTEKEVVLTGLPRYDRLYKASEEKDVPPPKAFLVMPTWRAHLAGAWDGKGQKRAHNPDFANSLFAKKWKRFFHSKQLESLCEKLGFTVLFRPHAGFIDYLDTFELPEHVKVPMELSVQQLLLDSRVLITDYSSLAFDMAFLKRPSLYYHFEERSSFTKGQNRRRGYFDYERDGFGPICRTEDSLLDSLTLLLDSEDGLAGRYKENIEKAFFCRDGQCCKRIIDVIMRTYVKLEP